MFLTSELALQIYQSVLLARACTLLSRPDHGQERVILVGGGNRLRSSILGVSVPALWLKVCPGHHRFGLWKVKTNISYTALTSIHDPMCPPKGL